MEETKKEQGTTKVSDVAKEIARSNMKKAFDMMHLQEENMMLKNRVSTLEERIIELEMQIAEGKA